MPRGPKPRSQEVLKRGGTFTKNPQRENKDAPKAIPGRPEVPEGIKGDEVAEAEWERVCNFMAEMDLLATADFHLIEQFVTTYSQWYSIHVLYKAEGIVDGNGKPRRWVPTYFKLAEQFRKLLPELGLSPSARSRLVTVTKKVNPLEQFLQKKPGKKPVEQN